MSSGCRRQSAIFPPVDPRIGFPFVGGERGGRGGGIGKGEGGGGGRREGKERREEGGGERGGRLEGSVGGGRKERGEWEHGIGTSAATSCSVSKADLYRSVTVVDRRQESASEFAVDGLPGVGGLGGLRS